MTLAPKKVLLVEDNTDLRELLTIIVKKLGHEVFVATTGEEAIERACAVRPDLIIMDINLPKLTGAEATVRIKQNPCTKNTPIVIQSALQMCPEMKRAIDAGAVEVLQKPVSVSEFQELLRRRLSFKVESSSHVE